MMELHKLLEKTIVRGYGATEADDYKLYSKAELLLLIAGMREDEVNDFCKDIMALIHHKDHTEGLYATDKDPEQLLRDFWQRTPDACPLEPAEARRQEGAFGDWALQRFHVIEFND